MLKTVLFKDEEYDYALITTEECTSLIKHELNKYRSAHLLGYNIDEFLDILEEQGYIFQVLNMEPDIIHF